MKIVFATNNAGKLAEIAHLLGEISQIECVGLQDYEIDLHPEETGQTFFENALIKARATATALRAHAPNARFLADDSGLEVDALRGEPGVQSAHFAGAHATDAQNNKKLLRALAGTANRAGRFRCVLVLVDKNGKLIASAEGTCEGRIASECRGTHGFGYDSLFIPVGYEKTLGEFELSEKNKLSHRGRACRALVKKLQELPSRNHGV